MAAPRPLAEPVTSAILLSRRKESRMFCMVRITLRWRCAMGKRMQCEVASRLRFARRGKTVRYNGWRRPRAAVTVRETRRRLMKLLSDGRCGAV